MAFLQGNISFTVYTDSAQTEFPTQLVPQLDIDFEDNAVTQAQASTITLAASGTQTINLNGISGLKRMYLYSDTNDLLVNMNGLGNITYKAQEPGYMPLELTSLAITNSSSSAATNVTVVLIAS